MNFPILRELNYHHNLFWLPGPPEDYFVSIDPREVNSKLRDTLLRESNLSPNHNVFHHMKNTKHSLPYLKDIISHFTSSTLYELFDEDKYIDNKMVDLNNRIFLLSSVENISKLNLNEYITAFEIPNFDNVIRLISINVSITYPLQRLKSNYDTMNFSTMFYGNSNRFYKDELSSGTSITNKALHKRNLILGHQDNINCYFLDAMSVLDIILEDDEL